MLTLSAKCSLDPPVNQPSLKLSQRRVKSLIWFITLKICQNVSINHRPALLSFAKHAKMCVLLQINWTFVEHSRAQMISAKFMHRKKC